MANTKTSKTAGETKADAEGNVPSGEVTSTIAVNGASPDTREADTAAVETTEDDAPRMSDLHGIRYRGLADRRILTRNDLIKLGVEEPKVQEDLVWDRSNGFTVPTAQFNAETRDKLLALKDFVAV